MKYYLKYYLRNFFQQIKYFILKSTFFRTNKIFHFQKIHAWCKIKYLSTICHLKQYFTKLWLHRCSKLRPLNGPVCIFRIEMQCRGVHLSILRMQAVIVKKRRFTKCETTWGTCLGSSRLKISFDWCQLRN